MIGQGLDETVLMDGPATEVEMPNNDKVLDDTIVNVMASDNDLEQKMNEF